MRRKAVLAVTGCTEQRFDSLARRDQLPFATTGGRWTEYSLDDAVKLRAFLDLVDRVGTPVDLACYIVGNGWGDLAMSSSQLRTQESLWLAGAVYQPSGWGDASAVPRRAHFAGRPQDVIASAEQGRDPGETLVSMVTVNVSAAADHVERAAHELGVHPLDTGGHAQ